MQGCMTALGHCFLTTVSSSDGPNVLTRLVFQRRQPSVVSSSSSSSSSSSILEPRGSLGHHRWFRNQFPPFFSVLHCPLGLGEFQACPFSDVVFPPLPLPALSSSPIHCALEDGFGQTWWTEDRIVPMQFASLYNDLLRYKTTFFCLTRRWLITALGMT